MNLAIVIIACATCYGSPDSDLTRGMNMAILTMLGVTGLVLGSLLAMGIYLVRRAQQHPSEETP